MSVKKVFVVLLALAAAVLVAGPAQAVITGTSHSVSTGNKSQCSVCHIPHGGAGARLWPVAPSAGVGVVATLCGTCHISTAAYGASFVGANSDTFVYGALSHGVQMTLTDIPNSNSLTGSGLPYTGDATQTAPTGGVMECTSCHNVHDDTNRPFLRASLETICQRCHSLRNYQAGTDSSGSGATWGAWGATIRATNPGSHPVGTDITGDVTAAPNSPITFPAQAQIIKSATANNWGLGGHRDGGDTGALGCNTCHAVHGIQADTGETAPPADQTPTANMLIFTQASNQNEGEARTVANGDGSFNLFCEACHTGTDPAGYGLANSNPNPGGTSNGHPVDQMNSTIDAGVTAFFVGGVPVGGGFAAGTNVGPIPICESCHTPHAAANNAARASILAGAGPFILRDAVGTVCGGCHTATPTGHHPVGQDVNTAITTGAAGYLSTGMTLGATLSCGTCHNGDGAHNWDGAGFVGINPNWRPADNGRDIATPTNDQFVGTGTAPSYYTSTTCVDCHLAFQGRGADPSSGTGAEAEFQNHGNGTHYLGPFAFASAALSGGGVKTYRGGAINGDASVDISTNSNLWPYGGWSRFGGNSGAPVLVCESCHELEPGKNAGAGNHMLLAPYQEGLAAIQDYADFCEGCHGVPAGTHPMTADVVGRTGLALSTTLGPAWFNASAPTALAGTTTWAAAQMSCDSCHQPHAAPTTGGTLILEGPAANVTGGATVNITMGGVAGNGGVVAQRVTNAVGTLPNFSRYCDQCHSYLQ